MHVIQHGLEGVAADPPGVGGGPAAVGVGVEGRVEGVEGGLGGGGGGGEGGVFLAVWLGGVGLWTGYGFGELLVLREGDGDCEGGESEAG